MVSHSGQPISLCKPGCCASYARALLWCTQYLVAPCADGSSKTGTNTSSGPRHITSHFSHMPAISGLMCHTDTLVTLITHHSHTTMAYWLQALMKYYTFVCCTRHVFAATWASLAGTALYYSCLHTAYTHQDRWAYALGCGRRYATTCIHCTVTYAPCGGVSTPTINTKGLTCLTVRLFALWSALPYTFTSLISLVRAALSCKGVRVKQDEPPKNTPFDAYLSHTLMH